MNRGVGMEIDFEWVRPTVAHAEIVMRWRNDPETLAMSNNQTPKILTSFVDEFRCEYFTMPNLPPLFALVDGKRVGFLRFRPYPHSLAQGRKTTEISINIAPEYRGKGLGSEILRSVTPLVKSQGCGVIFAEIKPKNQASIHAFEKAGYCKIGMDGSNLLYQLELEALNSPVLIIAEAGSNWRMGSPKRDLAMAKALIDVAVEARANVVKFQTYRPESVYAPNAGKSDYLAEAGIQEEISEIFADLSMPYEMIPKLAEYCDRCGIEFMSTPFSKADFLQIDPFVKRHKVASYEISHLRLLELCAKSGKPLILSTGAANDADVAWAVETFYKNGGGDLTLLQCTAKYPAPSNSMHLQTIPYLKARFKTSAGLSDHSRDPIYAPLAAVALGATVIEKHYTLDNRLPGPDHSFAITASELKEMVKAIREGELMRGNYGKSIDSEERELSLFARRGIQAIRDISPGELFEEGVNIDILRPGKNVQGIHPKHIVELNGTVAKMGYKAGSGIDQVAK
jgi:sialic acid synthase SpsE/RimJ/RimL family protein N-acetyltransferase